MGKRERRWRKWTAETIKTIADDQYIYCVVKNDAQRTGQVSRFLEDHCRSHHGRSGPGVSHYAYRRGEEFVVHVAGVLWRRRD